MQCRKYYALLAVMAALSILFFFDIKWMVWGLNILMLDVFAVSAWGLCLLWKWAGNNSSRELPAAIAACFITLGAFLLSVSGFFGSYIECTEPQTRRTFVAEYYDTGLHNQGSVRLYERFGPLLLPCDTEEYVGNFLLHDAPSARLSEDGEHIVVAYFFLQPVFLLPLN